MKKIYYYKHYPQQVIIQTMPKMWQYILPILLVLPVLLFQVNTIYLDAEEDPLSAPITAPITAPVDEPVVTSSSSSSSSSSSGSNNSDPFRCGKEAPPDSPKLYKIISDRTQATLYFTPVLAADNYAVEFGTKSGVYVHGLIYNESNKDGTLKIQINNLVPNTKYFFHIRGRNTCAGGPWSNELFAVTGRTSRSYQAWDQIRSTVQSWLR